MESGVTASMDDIACRAGVGSGTLYRHFPTREALILALVADDLERLAALADELRSRESSNGLESWLAELVEHNRTYRGLAESIIASTGKPTPLGAACDRLHNAGAALVPDAQAGGTVRADITPRDAIDLAGAVAWTTQHDPDDRRCRRLLQVAMVMVGTDRQPDPPPVQHSAGPPADHVAALSLAVRRRSPVAEHPAVWAPTVVLGGGAAARRHGDLEQVRRRRDVEGGGRDSWAGSGVDGTW